MSLPFPALPDSDVPVVVRFTSSYREVVDALRAVNRAAPLVRRLRFLAWLAIAVVVVLLATNVLGFWSALPILFVPLLILLLLWVMPFRLAWMTWRRSPYWSGEQILEFSSSGIHFGSSASESFVDWAAIIRTVEDRRFFLFYSFDQGAQFIPRRAMTPDQESRIRQLFRERAGKAGAAVSRAVAVNAARTPPAVEIRFELDAAETARAGIIAARKGGSLWVSYVMIVALVLWSTVPAAYRQWQLGGWRAISVSMILFGMVPLLIIIVGAPLAARWATRRALRTGPSTRGVQSVGVADWGIRVGGPMHAGDMTWAVFMRAVETSEFFLFFISKLQPVFIPKRLLSSADTQRIRDLASAGLGNRAALLRDER